MWNPLGLVVRNHAKPLPVGMAVASFISSAQHAPTLPFWKIPAHSSRSFSDITSPVKLHSQVRDFPNTLNTPNGDKNNSHDLPSRNDALSIQLSVLHAVTHLTLTVEIETVTIPTLQVRILRLREVKSQAQDHKDINDTASNRSFRSDQALVFTVTHRGNCFSIPPTSLANTVPQGNHWFTSLGSLFCCIRFPFLFPVQQKSPPSQEPCVTPIRHLTAKIGAGAHETVN